MASTMSPREWARKAHQGKELKRTGGLGAEPLGSDREVRYRSRIMALKAPPGLKDAGTNELLAILEVMYLVATADGFFSIEERREFLANVESLSEGKLGSEQLVKLVDSWSKRGPGPMNERLAQLASSLPDETSRRIAYGLALQIADSDGQYLNAEAALLDQIATAFGLGEEDSEDIAVSVRMSRGAKD